MNKVIRRFLLLLISPLILIGFSLATFIWWLMEDEFDSIGWKLFMEAWNK